MRDESGVIFAVVLLPAEIGTRFSSQDWRYNIVMSRWLAVAALGASLRTLAAWAHGGGGGSRGFAGHAGFAGAHPMFGGRDGARMNSPRFAGVRRGRDRFDNEFGRRSSRFFRHDRRFFHEWPYVAYYGYPWDYGDDSYSSDSYRSYPPSDYSNAYVDNSREQEQIDRLENEVDRLRAEREARESQASQLLSKTDAQATELVFRDKHTE